MYDDVPDLPGKRRKPPQTHEQALSLLTPAILDTLSVSELLDLRSQVEQRLPAKDLKDLDLTRELVLQVLSLQQMQQVVMADSETPANQKAQVANSLSSALANLVKVQGDVYTSERLKRMEARLIETLLTLPLAAQEEFLRDYEAALRG